MPKQPNDTAQQKLLSEMTPGRHWASRRGKRRHAAEKLPKVFQTSTTFPSKNKPRKMEMTATKIRAM